jgi:hypothetical protein
LPHELGNRLAYVTAQDIANFKRRYPELKPWQFDTNDLASLAECVKRDKLKPFNDVFVYPPPEDESGKGFTLGSST